MRVIGYRPQRTLAASAEIEGVGFITGARVRVRFRPAQSDTGIVFHRIDRPARPDHPRPRRIRHRHRPPHHARPPGARRHPRRTPPRGARGAPDRQLHGRTRRPRTAGPRRLRGRVRRGAHRGRDGASIGPPTDPHSVAPIVVSGGGATIGLHPGENAELACQLPAGLRRIRPRSRGRSARSTFAPANFAREVARAGHSSPSARLRRCERRASAST